jgi:hypothetical protein
VSVLLPLQRLFRGLRVNTEEEEGKLVFTVGSVPENLSHAYRNAVERQHTEEARGKGKERRARTPRNDDGARSGPCGYVPTYLESRADNSFIVIQPVQLR